MVEFHIIKNDQQIEDEQIFDLNVKSNFPEVFELYLTNQNHIPCYFCDYISKSQALKDIKTEITKHMETNHEHIIKEFKSDNTEIENITHLEFLELFVHE